MLYVQNNTVPVKECIKACYEIKEYCVEDPELLEIVFFNEVDSITRPTLITMRCSYLASLRSWLAGVVLDEVDNVKKTDKVDELDQEC